MESVQDLGTVGLSVCCFPASHVHEDLGKGRPISGRVPLRLASASAGNSLCTEHFGSFFSPQVFGWMFIHTLPKETKAKKQPKLLIKKTEKG